MNVITDDRLIGKISISQKIADLMDQLFTIFAILDVFRDAASVLDRGQEILVLQDQSGVG
jgi:hypothetical protein